MCPFLPCSYLSVWSLFSACVTWRDAPNIWGSHAEYRVTQHGVHTCLLYALVSVLLSFLACVSLRESLFALSCWRKCLVLPAISRLPLHVFSCLGCLSSPLSFMYLAGLFHSWPVKLHYSLIVWLVRFFRGWLPLSLFLLSSSSSLFMVKLCSLVQCRVLCLISGLFPISLTSVRRASTSHRTRMTRISPVGKERRKKGRV